MMEFDLSSMKEPPFVEDMSGVGDQAIFVGTTGSVAVDSGVKGVGGERIYFATDEANGIVKDDQRFMVREQERTSRCDKMEMEIPELMLMVDFLFENVKKMELREAQLEWRVNIYLYSLLVVLCSTLLGVVAM
ncbi:hypothetical protein BUALT_Bualt13G0103400 [Buddleja alternifolia]|uniref:Uncharacterized protein n=1 Tax=Buddleja alternifolia TaxID=168488 RepID=A0AAV6WM11_9LAMI|nr:hypothetical protein BUALT_Bualt13G0103400 [Buddleja alternifolia]